MKITIEVNIPTPKKFGYSQMLGYENYFKKEYDECSAQIYWNQEQNCWIGAVERLSIFIENQKEIDEIQIVFNNVQRDVKELNDEAKKKTCRKETN